MFSYEDIKNGEGVYYNYKYRYLFAYSLLAGAGKNSTRTDAGLGQVLYHESAANNSKTKPFDYLEKYQISEISDKSPSISISDEEDKYNFSIQNYLAPNRSYINIPAPKKGSGHYNYSSIYRTTNTLAADANFELVNDTYIYCEDVPMVKMLRIISYTEPYVNLNPDVFVITARVNSQKITNRDLGNIITFAGGEEAELLAVEATSGEQQRLLCGKIVPYDYSSIVGNIAFFGSQRGYNLDRQIDPSGNISYLISSANRDSIYNQGDFTSDDIGKIVVLSDNTILIITDVNDLGDRIYVSEVGGGPGENLLEERYFSGTIGFSGRVFSDNVKDDTLKARRNSAEPLFYLQTRFHEPLPNNNIGQISSGFLFLGSSIKNEYYYSQLSNVYRSGCYHPAFQYNDIFKVALTRIEEYPNKVLIIWGENYTYYVDTNIISNAGDNRLGEFIPTLPDPELITDRIGCPSRANAAKVADGAEFIFTSEPAIRVFDGRKYTDDLTQGRVHDSELIGFNQKVIAYWSKLLGLRIRGIK